MKNVFVVLLTVCLLFSATACSAPNGKGATPKVFSIDKYSLQIEADSTFNEETGGSFDLQITNDDAYVSVMAYKYSDLAEGLTPQNIFNSQNEDLFSRRENVSVVEDVKTQEASQRTIVQKLYSAEKDGVKNYYGVYLVDIPDKETFAWILVTTMPSYWEDNSELLNSIAYSLTPAE